MLIFGKGLDSPIAIPARNKKQNNVEVIMEEIDKLEISDKKITLLSNPMRIIITTICPPRGKGKKQLPVKFIENNEKGRIKINNVDENCLYYAAEMARIYALCSENTIRRKFAPFHKIIKNTNMQKELVNWLLRELNIKKEKGGSSLEEIVSLQEFYDKFFPGQFRIIIFKADNIYLKPFWKGERARKHNLILYLENNHYDVIKSVPLFFKLKKKYCLECEIPYSR